MQNVMIVIGLCTTLFATSLLPADANDDSWEIALGLDIPGKNGLNTCAPFARELYSRLSRAGGETYLLIFDWRDALGNAGRHAMVVYRDGQNRYWGMDQNQWQPVWLAGQTPTQWAQFFSTAPWVKLATVYTDPRNFGQCADLSREPRNVVYAPYPQRPWYALKRRRREVGVSSI